MMRHIYFSAILLAVPAFAGTAQEIADPDSIQVSIELDNLVVTAKKDVVKSDGAKLSYSLEEDESSKGLNLLDALRKVPMVSVDAQDNIRINGQSNFKIYVNGREDTMLETNYQRIFKAMPAESVANIEVITEPGAQYDAEGVGGILNLITESKTQKQDGYSGSVGLSYGNRQSAIFGDITGRLDKVYASANLTYADNGPSRQINNSRTETVFNNDDIYHRRFSENDMNVTFRFLQASLNMSWEPNRRNLFTVGGSYNNVNARIGKSKGLTQIFDKSNVLRMAYSNYNDGKMKNGGANANASYRLAFNDEATHRIIFGYQFNFGNSLLDYNVESEEVMNYPIQYPWQINHNNTFTREHTVQVDYSNMFGGSRHKLDIGFKGIIRHNTAISYGFQAMTSDELPDGNANDLNAAQNQDIYAGYASYTGTFNPVSVTAGLRYEHTLMGMDFRRGEGVDFNRHLNDWVPNASVSYIFSPAHSLRLAYQMRISRPTLDQMNPFRFALLDQIQTGNPELCSEHSNQLSLTYTNFGRILGGNIKLQYSQIDNGIIHYDTYEGPVQIPTYGNYGERKTVSLNGFLNINITSNMTLSLTGEVRYTDLRSDKLEYCNSGWGGSYGANWSWTGPWDLKFNAYGGQSFRDITLQGWWGGWNYYGIGIGKDLLKDKSLHVNMNASNFFTSTQSFKSYSYTEQAVNKMRYTHKTWQVGISLSWNFGSLKERVKSTGLELDNDDQSKTKGNGAISTGR